MGVRLCDFEDLANDVEIVFLRLLVDRERWKGDIPNFLPSVMTSCYVVACHASAKERKTHLKPTRTG